MTIKPFLGSYDFGDVLHSIRANETTGEVAKKFLSAAAALSERSDSSPVFMMWTLPTTILALMGLVYFVGKELSLLSEVLAFNSRNLLQVLLQLSGTRAFLTVVELILQLLLVLLWY